MKIGFIINDLASMNLEKDTSVYLMKEANMRGNQVFAFDSKDVTHKETALFAECKKIDFPNPSELNFITSDVASLEVKDFDFVINRLNPPFNKEYLYLTQMLEISGVDCINPAKALRENNEKLMILNFPEIIPTTVVTNSLDEIENIFENTHIEKIVIKPLDGMGGKSIFTIEKGDKNLSVIWETVSQNGKKHFIIQEFVEEARLGDHRLVFINYELLPKKVVRVPSEKDFRGNLAVGAVSRIETITDHDKEIAKCLIPYLKKNKIYFAGADLLGGRLSEINITSPTCLQEIHKNSDLNPAKIFWDNLDKDK
jgi:glutathione synthase|tara:strand:- start:4018 stop:4953 length:936 start_codon:yes stop_codon:yes gene_type:complete